MRAKRLAVLLLLTGATITAVAQVRPYTPPRAESGGDWSSRITEIVPPGVETRSEATDRIAAYQPDPVKYPVPRTMWDGKPDFSGVYWPGGDKAKRIAEFMGMEVIGKFFARGSGTNIRRSGEN